MNPNDIKISLQYRIRYPEQKTQNTPSLFLLHGFGSNMDDLFALNQFFPDDWTIISLQAPISTGFGGWAWAEIDFNNLKELPKPEQRYSSREMVISSINTFLLYGENIGLKKDIRELIINTKNKKDEKAEFISFYENDITSDEKRFYSSVYSGSLFSLFFT